MPSVVEEAAPRTTIHVKVKGCAGCEIVPFNFRTQEGAGEGRVVRNGRVTFRVRAGLTRGLGFFIVNSHPDADYSAERLAVARYGGKSAGDIVTAEQAEGAGKGTQCWAGTKRESVTLRLKVRHYATTDPMGEPADGIRGYFSPTLKSMGKPWATFNGSLGTQSVIDCSGNYPD